MRNTQRKTLKLQLFYFILLVLGLRFVFVYVMKHLEVWYTSENICAIAKCCFAAVVFSFSDSIDMSVNHTLARTAALSRAARGPHNGAAQERGRQKTPILPETEPGFSSLRPGSAILGTGVFIMHLACFQEKFD